MPCLEVLQRLVGKLLQHMLSLGKRLCPPSFVCDLGKNDGSDRVLFVGRKLPRLGDLLFEKFGHDEIIAHFAAFRSAAPGTD